MPGYKQNNCQNARQAQILVSNRQVSNNMRTDCTMDCNSHSDHGMNAFPVGMAYVPWQKWQNIYEPEMALRAGTLFKDLDLKFYGIRGCGK